MIVLRAEITKIYNKQCASYAKKLGRKLHKQEQLAIWELVCIERMETDRRYIIPEVGPRVDYIIKGDRSNTIRMRTYQCCNCGAPAQRGTCEYCKQDPSKENSAWTSN